MTSGLVLSEWLAPKEPKHEDLIIFHLISILKWYIMTYWHHWSCDIDNIPLDPACHLEWFFKMTRLIIHDNSWSGFWYIVAMRHLWHGLQIVTNGLEMFIYWLYLIKYIHQATSAPVDHNDFHRRRKWDFCSRSSSLSILVKLTRICVQSGRKLETDTRELYFHGSSLTCGTHPKVWY